MKTTIAAALFFVVSSSAFAMNLAEKKQFAEWQAYLTDASQSHVETAKKNCGYDIPVTIEDKFTTPFMAANTSAASYCDSARSTISDMCQDAMSKAEITKKIKKITCKLGKAEEATFKLNGTELVFTVGLGASNLEQKTKKFLESNL